MAVSSASGPFERRTRGSTVEAAQNPRPSSNTLAIEWIAGIAIILALLAFGTVRIACGDIAWHLATAKVAFLSGSWPVTNTFSHTFPGHPLYQQYPLFDSLVFVVHRVGGWSGLSVLLAAGWLTVFLLFVRWAGPWSWAARLGLAWMIGMMAFQRRMILRPDMLTMLWLGCMLIAIDAYLHGRRRAIWLVPLIHLCWVNSHQLFPLSFGVQGLLIAHLLLARWGRLGIDRSDHRVPLRPVIIAAVASIGVSVISPMGLRVFEIMVHTGGTLEHHRRHIRELAYIWQRTPELVLAVACGLPAAWAVWRARRQWSVFDMGLLAMSLGLTLLAVRGILFFSVLSIGVFARTVIRTSAAPVFDESPARAARRAAGPIGLARPARACAALILACVVIHFRWIDPPIILGGTQPGVGRSRGDWPDAATRYLRQSPPPGPMMNMPWSLANGLLDGVPNNRHFVDGRFEAYPRDFLLTCIESYADDQVLDRLIRETRTTWIAADHRVRGIRPRVVNLIRGGTWTPVHMDSQIVILVRACDQTSDYMRGRRLEAPPDEPPDLLPDPPQLRVRQRIHYARLLADLGRAEPAAVQLDRARLEADGRSDSLRLIEAAQRDLAATTAPRPPLQTAALPSR